MSYIDSDIDTFVIKVDEYMEHIMYMISHPKVDNMILYITGLSTLIGIGLIIMK